MAEEQKQTKSSKTTDARNGEYVPPLGAGAHDILARTVDTAAPAPDTEPAATSASQVADPATAIDVSALQQEIENLREQLEETRDRMLRTQADMDNLRKRTVRDVEYAHKYALDKFVGELLPVLDSLELGLSTSNGSGGIESFREGMDLTLKKFLAALEKFGVTVVEPQGDKFNPEKHEAVTMQAQAGAESGTVLNVLQKGYELNGRLIRPAMVIVAK